ncbi:hypothetical protein FM038_007195 [Shewanella eurypsychrophilus]|uniref:Uncharacterized protein n=1 Tax=Shewanella eurypsychrophilus TaxID=2593656 RepID=A0ABX6V9T5_9GAMM|nr:MULTISPECIES: hypothetical protein [Shewanella]QFU21959.1 hypothetical protein FS418_08775 [Shewanella sp. YLB-09]QPG57248.1 hypothetical protein FM038_007195 [Shewanella eurypsychrophilus]
MSSDVWNIIDQFLMFGDVLEGRTFIVTYRFPAGDVQLLLLHAVNPSMEARRWHPCHQRPQLHLHLVIYKKGISSVLLY